MATEASEEPNMTVRYVSLLWGVIFLGSGLTKLVALDTQEQIFRNMGFPAWVLPVVGALEMLMGALVLSPRWRAWGALAIALESVVFGLTHVVTSVMLPMAATNAVFFVGAVYVLIKERSTFFPRRHATQ